MALVIDAKDLVDNRKKLPTEAFFVDTNILINYKDPFGSHAQTDSIEKEAENIQKILHSLKSYPQLSSFSTRSVALEYYKYIQFNSIKAYNLVKETHYGSGDLKFLRKKDSNFAEVWELRMKEFLRIFKRNFPIFEEKIEGSDILLDFRYDLMDFGDHLLYKTVTNCNSNLQCIFSNDSDLYSIPEDVYLLTTNKKVIRQAKKESKIFYG